MRATASEDKVMRREKKCAARRLAAIRTLRWIAKTADSLIWGREKPRKTRMIHWNGPRWQRFLHAAIRNRCLAISAPANRRLFAVSRLVIGRSERRETPERGEQVNTIFMNETGDF